MKNRHNEPVAPEAAALIEELARFREKVAALPSTSQENREAITDALDNLAHLVNCLADVGPETQGRPNHAIII